MYEAEEFGITSIVVNKMGKRNFRNCIRNGYFYYAESADEVVDILNNNRKANKRKKKYFETDENKAKNTIYKLLRESKGK